MLLNVGPRPDGMLCPEEISSLKAIGRWMKVNGEAIYGTTASPFNFDFQWGSMTQKGKKLYLIGDDGIFDKLAARKATQKA